MIADMPWHTHHYLSPTRHYTALLHQDLFDQWILTKIWGARGSRLGRVVDVRLRDYAEGLAMLEAVKRQRARRGYLSISFK
jgi:hypothetical protein